ncbi:MAG: hypothetical protein ACLU9S_11460 [Oscillospiraceae bacterium]
MVTSNASGFDKDTAFFDCIYVQDGTGGICCFPVAGEYQIPAVWCRSPSTTGLHQERNGGAGRPTCRSWATKNPWLPGGDRPGEINERNGAG